MITAAADAATKETARLYDWLSRYVQLANWLSYGDRYAGFTMHKALVIPDAPDPTHGTRYVNERLLAVAQLREKPFLLDAGCGFGGTVFHFADCLGGRYDGYTMSAVQARIANREAARRGLDACCRFSVRSYEDAIDKRYDAVVAIETLVHAGDLTAVINNLSRSLNAGGKLLLVEDLPQVDLQMQHPHEAQMLQQYWACRRWAKESELRDAMQNAGLRVEVDEDLTERVSVRPPEVLARLERRYRRLYRLSGSVAPVRAVLSAYLGGLAIERLYAYGALRYRLIVARRSHGVTN